MARPWPNAFSTTAGSPVLKWPMMRAPSAAASTSLCIRVVSAWRPTMRSGISGPGMVRTSARRQPNTSSSPWPGTTGVTRIVSSNCASDATATSVPPPAT